MADEQQMLQLTFLGDPCTGKTCLTLKLFSSEYWDPEYEPTGDRNIHRKEINVDDKPCFIWIHDTGGAEKLESRRQKLIRNSDGVMLAFDVTSQDSFDRIESYWASFMEEGVPVTLVATKCDLEPEVEFLRANEYANQKGWGYVETSSMEYSNVEQAFSDCARRVLQRRQRVSYSLATNLWWIGEFVVRWSSPWSCVRPRRS